MTEPNMSIPPVSMPRRERIMDHVVYQLADLIVEGVLPPGTILRQEALASQLGVSRTPFREALQQLERDGYIVFQANGSAAVVDYDLAEAMVMMEVREVVDGIAARLAARTELSRNSQRDLAALTEQMHEASVSDDKHQYLHLNAEFHRAVLDVSGSSRLQQFQPLVRITSQAVYLRHGHQPSRHQRSAAEHEEILKAILSGDAELAERLAREHIQLATAHWILPVQPDFDTT